MSIAFILKTLTSIRFNSKNLKLDHDKKNNHFGLYQFSYLRLNSQSHFENWQKLVKNGVLKINQLDM